MVDLSLSPDERRFEYGKKDEDMVVFGKDDVDGKV